jgi:hypothetical protein
LDTPIHLGTGKGKERGIKKKEENKERKLDERRLVPNHQLHWVDDITIT